MSVDVRTPAFFPTRINEAASSSASCSVSRKAPLPNLTSNTNASSDSAIFLDMILAVINGIEGTVAVTSRRPYSFLSAGTRVSVAPVMTQPNRFSWPWISDSERLVRKPSMDSSLSSVPPVIPSPRPLIMGTCNSQQASSGAKMRDVLSPRPPVECLSTRGTSPAFSNFTPLAIMESVRSEISRSDMPLMNMAIASADIW